MKKLNKKGFTLIELMIVLAIIAILAVVLVPKAGQMKDNARNAGVTTNVNAVRGTLEAKVVDTNYLGNTLNTATLLTNTFPAANSNALANPFDATCKAVGSAGYIATRSDIPTTDSIEIYHPTGAVATAGTLTSNATNKGKVFVYVYTDGYVIFGVDSTGAVVNQAIIK